MRSREGQTAEAGLSGEDRGAIEEFLAYIEDRVSGVEPICAMLVRMARLALSEPEALLEPDRVLH